MARQVFCSECHEDFRASSIFVERPRLTRCPYCGARLEPALEPPTDRPLIDPGYDPTPLRPKPVHRAA